MFCIVTSAVNKVERGSDPQRVPEKQVDRSASRFFDLLGFVAPRARLTVLVVVSPCSVVHWSSSSSSSPSTAMSKPSKPRHSLPNLPLLGQGELRRPRAKCCHRSLTSTPLVHRPTRRDPAATESFGRSPFLDHEGKETEK
jgi:hypothetical protein